MYNNAAYVCEEGVGLWAHSTATSRSRADSPPPHFPSAAAGGGGGGYAVGGGNGGYQQHQQRNMQEHAYSHHTQQFHPAADTSTYPSHHSSQQQQQQRADYPRGVPPSQVSEAHRTTRSSAAAVSASASAAAALAAYAAHGRSRSARQKAYSNSAQIAKGAEARETGGAMRGEQQQQTQTQRRGTEGGKSAMVSRSSSGRLRVPPPPASSRGEVAEIAGPMANPLPLRSANTQGGGGVGGVPLLMTRSSEGPLLGGGGDVIANFATGDGQQQQQQQFPPHAALLPLAPSAAVGVRSPQRGGRGGTATHRRSISGAHNHTISSGGGLPTQQLPPSTVSSVQVDDVGGAASGGGGVRAFAHDGGYAHGVVGVRAANASASRHRASSEAQPNPTSALPLEPLVSGGEEGEVRKGEGEGNEINEVGDGGKPLPLLPPFVAPFPSSTPPPPAAANNDGSRRGNEGPFAAGADGGGRRGEANVNGSSNGTVGGSYKKRKDVSGGGKGAAVQRSASEGLLIQNILSKLIVDDPIGPEDAAIEEEEAAEFLLPFPSPSSAPPAHVVEGGGRYFVAAPLPLPPPPSTAAAISGGGGLLRPQPKAAVVHPRPLTAADINVTRSNTTANNNINTNVAEGAVPLTAAAATASVGNSRTATPAAASGVVLTPHALLEAFGANQQRLWLREAEEGNNGGARPFAGPAMAPSVAPIAATPAAVGRVPSHAGPAVAAAEAHHHYDYGDNGDGDNNVVLAPHHHQQLQQPQPQQQYPQPQHMHTNGGLDNEFAAQQQQQTYHHHHHYQEQRNSLQQQEQLLPVPPHQPFVVATEGHPPLLPHPATERQQRQQQHFSHQNDRGRFDDKDALRFQQQQQQQQQQLPSLQQQAAKLGQHHHSNTDYHPHHALFQERHRYDRAVQDDSKTAAAMRRGVGAAAPHAVVPPNYGSAFDLSPPPPNRKSGRGNALEEEGAVVGVDEGAAGAFLRAHGYEHGRTRGGALDDDADDSSAVGVVVVDLPPDEALLSFAEAVASHGHHRHDDYHHHGRHQGRLPPPPSAAQPAAARAPAAGDGSFVPIPAHNGYHYFSGTHSNTEPQRRAAENRVGRSRSRSKSGTAAAAGARVRATLSAASRRQADGHTVPLVVGGNINERTHDAITHSGNTNKDAVVVHSSDAAAAPSMGAGTACREEEKEGDAEKRSAAPQSESSHLSCPSSSHLFAEAEAHRALLNAAEHAQNAISAIRSLVYLRGGGGGEVAVIGSEGVLVGDSGGGGGGGGNPKYPLMDMYSAMPSTQWETKEEAFDGASTYTANDGVAAAEAVAGAAAVASVAVLEAQLRQLTSTKRSERFVSSTYALAPPTPPARLHNHQLPSSNDSFLRQDVERNTSKKEEEAAQQKGDSAGHSKGVGGNQRVLSFDSSLVGFYTAVERHGGWYGGPPPSESLRSSHTGEICGVGDDRPTAEGVLALARRHAQLRAARAAVRRCGVMAASEAGAEAAEGLATVDLRLNALRQRMAVMSLAPSIAVD